MTVRDYVGSDAAREASAYFNALPDADRARLAPLLEHYRQMGLAEGLEASRRATRQIEGRIRRIKGRT